MYLAIPNKEKRVHIARTHSAGRTVYRCHPEGRRVQQAPEGRIALLSERNLGLVAGAPMCGKCFTAVHRGWALDITAFGLQLVAPGETGDENGGRFLVAESPERPIPSFDTAMRLVDRWTGADANHEGE